MCSGNRLSLIARAFLVLDLFLVAGCNPHKDQIRPDGLFNRIGGGRSGEIIEARRCLLRVAILNRPFRDPVINEVVWKTADEQAISPEARRVLQANGLRVGRITGDLPLEIEKVLDAPPPNKIDPVSFLVEEETHANINICEAVDEVSLLLNRDDRVFGKDYKAASGYFLVTPRHHQSESVSLRITPEVRFGPNRQTIQPMEAAPYAPQDFKIANGQEAETLPDLAASLILDAGQVAVIGCIPEQERSLGSFLFTLADPHSDQRTQRLVLIWASRNQSGLADDKKTPPGDGPAASGDRGPLGLLKSAITPANDEVKK